MLATTLFLGCTCIRLGTYFNLLEGMGTLKSYRVAFVFEVFIKEVYGIIFYVSLP